MIASLAIVNNGKIVEHELGYLSQSLKRIPKLKVKNSSLFLLD